MNPGDAPAAGPGARPGRRHLPFGDPNWYLVPRLFYSGGNRIELLRGGDQLFPAMCRAIARARHEVWLASYLFHDDDAARGVVEALKSAARRGVRVVVDGFGSKAAADALQRGFEHTGVRFAVFRPVRGWWSWMQPGQLRRLHQKLCVVDREVGFVGGINLLDDRLDLRHGRTEQPRLDYAVELRGPVVEPIAQTARALWTRAHFGRDWREELIAVARSAQPVRSVRQLMRRLRMGSARQAGARSDRGAGRPVQIAFVVRDNLRQRHTIEQGYIEAIGQARHRVDLVCPYFYPGHRFRRALREAAARGVEVRLVMQGRWDYASAALAAKAVYAELLGRGVRIFEYMPAFLHAKVAVVDDDWSTIGSSNIDPLSLLLNLEANVVVRDAPFAARLSNEIEAAIAQSREVSPAEAGGRLALLKRALVASVARIFLSLAGSTERY